MEGRGVGRGCLGLLVPFLCLLLRKVHARGSREQRRRSTCCVRFPTGGRRIYHRLSPRAVRNRSDRWPLLPKRDGCTPRGEHYVQWWGPVMRLGRLGDRTAVIQRLADGQRTTWRESRFHTPSLWCSIRPIRFQLESPAWSVRHPKSFPFPFLERLGRRCFSKPWGKDAEMNKKYVWSWFGSYGSHGQ